MKNIKTLTIGILIGISISLPITSFGDNALQKVEAYLNPTLPISLDGKQLNLHNAPINYDGSIFLPLRETATILGKDVKWNESTSTVELSSKNTGGNTMSELITLPNYVVSSSPAMQYEDTIYLTLASGGDKYGIKRNIIFGKDNITFNGNSIKAIVSEKFTPNCDVFNMNGETYMKESIFTEAKAEIEKAQ